MLAANVKAVKLVLVSINLDRWRYKVIEKLKFALLENKWALLKRKIDDETEKKING